jgi:hypothetical protein
MTQAKDVNFSTFILSLASAAFIELGLVEDPQKWGKKSQSGFLLSSISI